MGNKKITDLPSATAVNSGDKIEIVQGGTSKQADVNLLSSGSGLSGLTTNKVLKATSSTTAGDSNITDDGTIVIIESPNSLNSIYVSNAISGYGYGSNESGGVDTNDSRTNVTHTIKNTFDAPLHEFNNSVTKNGVEVATVNDTVIIQQFGAASTNLPASLVYYFALVTANIGFLTLANSITRALNIIKTGVITNFEFFIYVGGTIGSSQNSVIDLLIFNSNGTLNRTINLSNTVLFNDANRINQISLSALSINVTQGEIYNFRLTTGALTTAPTAVQINGGFIIK